MPVQEGVPVPVPNCASVVVEESDGELNPDVGGVIGPDIVDGGVIDRKDVLEIETVCDGDRVSLALPPKVNEDGGDGVAVEETVVAPVSLPEAVGDPVDAGVPLFDPDIVKDGVADELSVLDELGELLVEIVELNVPLLEAIIVVESVPVLVGEFVDVDDEVVVILAVLLALASRVAELEGVLDNDGVSVIVEDGVDEMVDESEPEPVIVCEIVGVGDGVD